MVFLLTLAAIVYLSLYPADFTRPGGYIGWSPPRTPGEWVDVTLNVFLYVPLALAAPRVGSRQSRAWVVPFTFLLSATIEYAQSHIPLRDSNWRDVFCNTAGAMAGLGLTRLTRYATNHRLALASWPGLAASLLFVIWQAWPFLPSIRRATLWKTLADLQRFEVRPLELGDMLWAAAWLAWVWQPLGRAGWPLWAATMGAVPLQGLVSVLAASSPNWVAALAGFLAGVTLSPPRPLIAWGLTAWLAFRQLYPFRIREGAPAAFSWWPFQAWYEGAPAGYLNILAGKLFLYLIAIEAWRAAGQTLARGAGIVIPLLALTEGVQCRLAGRTPEITDVALAGVAALLLAAAPRIKHPGEVH